MKLYNFEKEENNCDEREEGLPMLRIVIQTNSPYPKPFKNQASLFLPCRHIVLVSLAAPYLAFRA